MVGSYWSFRNYLGGRADRDQLAEVQHEDRVADRHHQVHPVLDDDHARLGGHLLDQLAELGQFAAREAAGRLVEQQQAGPPGQGTGQCHPFPQPVGQRVRHPVGQVSGAHLGQGLHRALPQPPFIAVRAGQPEQRRPDPGAGRRGRADHDVLDHGQAAEQPDALQGAGDAEAGQPVCLEPGQRAPVEGDRAGLRPDKAARGVEQGGLARAVRADDSGDFARGGGQRYVVKCGEAAKPDGDTPNGQ